LSVTFLQFSLVMSLITLFLEAAFLMPAVRIFMVPSSWRLYFYPVIM